MQTHPMHHLKSRGGNSTSQIGTPEDHLPEEGEGDHRHTPHDHPLAGEAEEAEGVAEEHSLYPDTHLPRQLKSF